MGVASVNLRLSMRKGRYVGRLWWDSIRKASMEWDRLYGVGVFGIGDTIYSRYGKKFTETARPKRGTCFGKLMRGSKFWTGGINK